MVSETTNLDIGHFKSNREALFFIIGIRTLLGYFLLAFIHLFLFIFRGRRIFFSEKINKEDIYIYSGCGSKKKTKKKIGINMILDIDPRLIIIIIIKKKEQLGEKKEV